MDAAEAEIFIIELQVLLWDVDHTIRLKGHHPARLHCQVAVQEHEDLGFIISLDMIQSDLLLGNIQLKIAAIHYVGVVLRKLDVQGL